MAAVDTVDTEQTVIKGSPQAAMQYYSLKVMDDNGQIQIWTLWILQPSHQMELVKSAPSHCH